VDMAPLHWDVRFYPTKIKLSATNDRGTKSGDP